MVAEALDALPPRAEDDPDRYGPKGHALAGLFQSIGAAEGGAAMRDVALPRLIAAYDRVLADFPIGGNWTPGPERTAQLKAKQLPDSTPRETPEEKRGNLPVFVLGDLHFILKMLASYGGPEAAERIIAAARDPRLTGGFMWCVIFGSLSNQTAPVHATDTPRDVIDALRDPLPTGFTGVAYIDGANRLAHAGRLEGRHPFDTDAGIDLLRAWLTGADGAKPSYAHSATAALPFLERPERGELLALAMDHLDEGVQLEGAYAAARRGSAGGVRMLADATLDKPHLAGTARQYLEELGRADAIPAAADEPRHLALCEMASWLSHPQEFGRPPDALEVADDHEIDWPPTRDRRRMFVLRYRYDAAPGEDPDAGYGVVGSITFALFGEATADLSPEDALGLHCCWELEANADRRAPKERTAAAGRELLGI